MTNNSEQNVTIEESTAIEANKAKVISMINMKGGVGKTTLLVNVAYELATTLNKKVLVVDMDPQFNATQMLLTRSGEIDDYTILEKEGKTIAGLLLGKNSITRQANRFSINDVIHDLKGINNLHLIPGDLNLTDFESSTRGTERALNVELQNILTEFDYIFVDTPATYSIYSQSALIASDYYLTPLMPDMFAVLGYSLLSKKVKNDFLLMDHMPKSLGVVVNLWSSKLTRRQQIIESLNADYVFDARITDKEVNRSGSGSVLMADRRLNNDEIHALVEELLVRIDEVQ